MRTELDTPLAQIVAAAKQRSSRGVAIIAFADSTYLDIAMNWLVALALNDIDNYLIVALDSRLYAFLREHDIPVVLSEVSGDLGALWTRRVDIFTALCAAGVNFVHSDADAVWLRDPLASYLNDQDADITVSQGTVWPADVYRQFGFVLCCGLFSMRSTLRTQTLLGDLQRHVASTGDDQVSLNQLIAARSTRWRIELGDAYYIDGSGSRFLCSRSVMRGACSDGLRVAVLPHHLFQRVPVDSEQKPYVVHPLTQRDVAAKLIEFERIGCLMLRSDWRSTAFDARSLTRLRRHA